LYMFAAKGDFRIHVEQPTVVVGSSYELFRLAQLIGQLKRT
jgi:hypothetical protein